MHLSRVTCPGPKRVRVLGWWQGRARPTEGDYHVRRLRSTSTGSATILETNCFSFCYFQLVSSDTPHNTHSQKLDKFTSRPVHQIKILFMLRKRNTCHRYGHGDVPFSQVPLLQAAFLSQLWCATFFPSLISSLQCRCQWVTSPLSVYLIYIRIKLILGTDHFSLEWKCLALDDCLMLISIRDSLSVSFLLLFLLSFISVVPEHLCLLITNKIICIKFLLLKQKVLSHNLMTHLWPLSPKKRCPLISTSCFVSPNSQLSTVCWVTAWVFVKL